ncbi:RNA methyltransferase [Neisseria arctica]|uniref:RNA methyltransferase n=1 Tax=Neisseria arctica TaxID=1470200 RepID=A0A0J0YPI7_9NEIS|nr:RNA methyltransferase [Neisseria arctica]KLT72052.1 RNA methyltransferase [Neisseria arctica]UOO87337.1 RNA methyltransferase [Neisseria arctica]
MKTITSAQNEQLKRLAKLLGSAKARRETAQTVLEGIHLLQTYLQNGFEPLQVYVPESKLQFEEVQSLLVLLPPEKVVCVSKDALGKITSLAEGEDVMSLIAIPAEEALPQNGDCVVLERVQDPGNVGTILRSAAASGVSQVVLSEDSADVWSPKVLRAGMGAHFLLKLFRGDLLQWRQAYKGKVWATALSEKRHYSLYEMPEHMPCAWVFGNEGSGVSDSMLDSADGTVKIPMAGATESLNVAMAATICLFEQMRRRL